jgi:tetratricopeptide (TPR) repeat protein
MNSNYYICIMIQKTITIFLICSLLISSCGNGDKPVNDQNTDTAQVVSASPELKTINAEILADPGNPDLYHKRAKYYLNDKQFEEGLADMNRVLNLDSSKCDYYMTVSDLYFAVNKTANAKAALEKCISLDDKNVNAILKLAELYLYVNKSAKSIEYINQVLKIDQYNAKAYFMKGMNYKDLKDTAKAISSMQTAVEQDQEYYNAYMQLGLLSAAQNNKLAVDYYRNAIRIQPKSSEAWYGLGKYYQDIGDWKNAMSTYNELLKFDNNKNALYNIGVIFLVGTKEYNKAAEFFTAAINVDPKYAEAYYGRGVSYQTMGDNKRAAIDFQSCLSINPDYQPAIIALNKLK